MKKLKIWHISDTHEHHHMVEVPTGIDLVIFSGDEANNRDPYNNEAPSRVFFDWFKSLLIEHKVFVAGNHSSAIEKGLITRKEIEDMGIHYLENESIWIEHLHIWGSPLSPTFGNWCFQKSRHKIGKVWQHIPEGLDILITHTPPKGVLDLCYDHNGQLLEVGCSALAKRVVKVQPKIHCFGHIHDNEGLRNAGTTTKAYFDDIIFSNGACVTDFQYGKVTSHGNIFEL